MMSGDIHTLSLRDIVVQNFHAAAIFEKYHLDFCCRGGKTIRDACQDQQLDSNVIINELSLLDESENRDGMRFSEWEPDFLVNYIVQNHHSYVAKMLPILTLHTKKIAAVHGGNHPEVIQIERHFEQVAMELHQHMKKEEQILFPYINTLQSAKKAGRLLPNPQFGSVKNPIRMMEAEHQQAGDEMYSIRALSKNYTPPNDACTTYRVTYQELKDFEMDLHRHVHLENNILFPKAVALERELLSAT